MADFHGDFGQEQTSGALTGQLAKYLTPDEEIVYKVRRHFSVLIVPALPAVITFLAAFLWSFLSGPDVLNTILWWVFVVCLLWFVWRWAEWSIDWIVLTDKRILLLYGLVVRKIAMMPLSQVTDVGYRRSILGRLFGYGAVRLESPGQVQDLEHIDHLPNPEKFYRILAQLVLR
jgi:uncharacterized membrane protein YdbT with pleckstrin-like domain